MEMQPNTIQSRILKNKRKEKRIEVCRMGNEYEYSVLSILPSLLYLTLAEFH